MQRSGNGAVVAGSLKSSPKFSLGWSALEPLAACADVAALMLSSYLSPLIYMEMSGGSTTYSAVDFEAFGIVSSFTFVILSYLRNGYAPRANGGRQLDWRGAAVALRLWVISLAFMAMYGFMLKVGADVSRGAVVVHFVLGGTFIVLLRRFWPGLVREAIARDLIFVTDVLVVRVQETQRGVTAASSTDHRKDLATRGMRPLFEYAVEAAADAAAIGAMVGYAEDLMRRGKIREIVVLGDEEGSTSVLPVLEALRIVPVPVRLVLDPKICAIYQRKLTRAGSLVLAEYQRAPLSIVERAFKRALDLSVATTALILLSPLLLFTAIAVRIGSPGPVLFRQSRRGFGGKTFMILKFRSMTVAENGSIVTQAKKDDARVTRVGRVIRRTSIDELPQLLNVIAGQMSIVGPRPHAVAHDDYYSRYIEAYAYRHHAKPGLTGWAQVKGLRGETPKIENMQARIEKDLWYVDNWSIWLDMQIIVRTVLVVFGQKTAY